jgi:L-arabinose isomerase
MKETVEGVLGMEKPRLGVVFFAARWFEEVVLHNEASASEFERFLREDRARIVDRLSETCHVVECSLVTSREKAREASHKLLSESVDAVLLCFVVWSEDEYLLDLRDIMRIRPTILWTYTPYKAAPEHMDVMTLFRNSGFVASFESFGVLKRMGIETFQVTGSVAHEEPVDRIGCIARAARVRAQLRTARLGVLPYRNDQMIVTYVDELGLYTDIGPSVAYISVLQLKKASEAVDETDVADLVAWVKKYCRIDRRITDENLAASSRVSLGMAKIMEEHGLDGLALSDLNPELHDVVGLRPCIYPETLANSRSVVGNEGDLGGTTAMLMLQRLTGNPVMFTEIFVYDRDSNVVVAGHAGPSNHRLADETAPVSVTPDYELMDSGSSLSGVWVEFVGKPGRVTMVNFICGRDGFQLTVLGGESLGKKLRIDGYPHMAIRLDPAVEEFIRSNGEHGVSHHWAVVHGDVRDEMEHLAAMLGCPCIRL